MAELYVSLDIETDGPAPGLNNMLALGAAVFSRDGKPGPTWYSTLEPCVGAAAHPETAAWWQTQPEAWAEVCKDRRHPDEALPDFVAWLEGLGAKKLVAAAWPAAFDFAFVNYYCHRFVGRNPLGFACLDLRSLAQGLTYSRGYYDLRENQMRQLQGQVDRTGLREHVAVDDAIEQGRLLVALLARTKGGLPGGSPETKKLSAERVAEIKAKDALARNEVFAAELDDEDIDALLAHIDALQAENERMEAVLQEIIKANPRTASGHCDECAEVDSHASWCAVGFAESALQPTSRSLPGER